MIKNNILKIMMKVFHIFPMKNKVVFSSFWGKSYSDNPRYLFTEMKKIKPDYTYIWLLEDEKEKISGAKVVKFRSIKAIYHLATAKIWIDNARKREWVIKRKNQYYVQTWHGNIPLKKVEKDAEDKLTAKYLRCAKNDSKIADLFLSGSEWRTKNYREAFWYNGEILKMGMPKSDIFYDDISSIKEQFNDVLSDDTKYILYAPTFRADGNIECYNMDYLKLIETFEEKYGGKWKIFVRLHPNIQNKQDLIKYSENVINASVFPDLNELIVLSEVLITDYSGCMFDGMEAEKKVILYASDIDKYKNDRGFYFKLDELPFDIATNNDELLSIVKQFDDEKYFEKILNFRKILGFYDGKNSSKRIARYIFEKIEKY